MKLYLIVISLILNVNSAHADEYVSKLAHDFVQQLPLDWKYEAGNWEYFDAKTCFQGKQSCAGSNPTSPYGYPTFLNVMTNTFNKAIQIDQNEAVVLIFRTPPQNRYFGFTQYLMKKHNEPTPVFASLSDTLNLAKLGTSGENIPGVSVFNTYSAIVWSSNINTVNLIKQMLMSLNFPESAINFMPLPASIPDYAFSQGYGETGDQFTMLMRTALPNDQAELDAYLIEKPFFAGKIGPMYPIEYTPAPTIGYASEVSGILELDKFKNLNLALSSLVSDIRKKYGLDYNLRSLPIEFVSKTGWDCIAGSSQCAGDNHDALYSYDTKYPVTVKNLEDFIIVAGVNHQKTGKADYINHSVYDTVHFAGIAGVADTLLTTDSALYHAGVSSTDLKRIVYKNLYAYIISYDCKGKSYCLSIPAPTASNPVGLNPGAPFVIVGRSYMEPNTLVRPLPAEIVPHQVFSATKK
jgi:hypothetical protein